VLRIILVLQVPVLSTTFPWYCTRRSKYPYRMHALLHVPGAPNIFGQPSDSVAPVHGPGVFSTLVLCCYFNLLTVLVEKLEPETGVVDALPINSLNEIQGTLSLSEPNLFWIGDDLSLFLNSSQLYVLLLPRAAS